MHRVVGGRTDWLALALQSITLGHDMIHQLQEELQAEGMVDALVEEEVIEVEGE